jgi:CheY-like chemotaxis protein
MARILLVHWNAAEAEERAARLSRAGHEVRVHSSSTDMGPLRTVKQTPPEAILIDLTRLPSHGRAVAEALRQSKATRFVPLLFVDGEPEKVERTRKLLPDAIFTDWKGVRGALGRALRSPLEQPVVPAPMAGYSGTPLPKKLGLKSNSVVALLGAPAGFERTLEPLPEGIRFRKDIRGRARTILLFVKSIADLEKRFRAAGESLEDAGGLWIAWPKKTSALASDIGEKEVRAHGLRNGFVDYKVCAIDHTWSGLLFARRKRT